jgi:hypothetical protein
VEPVAQFRREHTRVVVVESTDGDGVVEQHAVIGDVDYVCRNLQIVADALAARDIESGVFARD